MGVGSGALVKPTLRSGHSGIAKAGTFGNIPAKSEICRLEQKLWKHELGRT